MNPVQDMLTRPDGLATRLREMRVKAKLSGKQLAERIGWQQSKVSRIETGQQLPSEQDVVAWTRVCKAPRTASARLAALLDVAAKERRDWQRRQRRGEVARPRPAASPEQLMERLLRQLEEVGQTARELRTAIRPAAGTTPDRPPAPYGERRPYAVADSLDDLHGPTEGVVRLPLRLNWSGTPTYDLNSPGVLRSMYQTVISEATGVEDLNAWLNRDELVRLWPEMHLPAKPRRLWEERFPELAAAGVRAGVA